MGKKCARCAILLDVPCLHPACDGHHNDSRGDVCTYCATNERERLLSLGALSPLLCSSLAALEDGEE